MSRIYTFDIIFYVNLGCIVLGGVGGWRRRRYVLQGYFVSVEGGRRPPENQRTVGSTPTDFHKSLNTSQKSQNPCMKNTKNMYLYSLYFSKTPQKKFFCRPSAGGLTKPYRNNLYD